MDAIKTLTSIATAAMKPLAKAGGFKKKELTWRRRHDIPGDGRAPLMART